MTYGQAYALARRNADACENATETRCTCVCGGRFHGKQHPGVFVAEYAGRLQSAEAREQLDLLERDQQGRVA